MLAASSPRLRTIVVDGKKHSVLPKDYQLDPVRDFLMHVDIPARVEEHPGDR